MKPKPTKPLGRKAYGSIPHLPGSRRGPGDYGLSEQQAALLTVKTRDKNDLVIVQEKLDGSNVAVAKINGEIVALMRAGFRASDSHFKQHHFFADWVKENEGRFGGLLQEGERVVGEWLMEAHGTRYNLPHEPFVAFDIMVEEERKTFMELFERCERFDLVTPSLLHHGGAWTIEQAMSALNPAKHGAIDPIEGAVWRMERAGKVDFLGKYVRAEKEDGKFLESVTGNDPIFNWRPISVLR